MDDNYVTIDSEIKFKRKKIEKIGHCVVIRWQWFILSLTKTINQTTPPVSPERSCYRPAGREITRQELRSLRENWEAFADSLSDAQRQLEVCLGQLTSFHDSAQQFAKWLAETTAKVRPTSPNGLFYDPCVFLLNNKYILTVWEHLKMFQSSWLQCKNSNWQL